MEREIVLSSYSVKNKDNNKPENFVTDFVRPIILDSNHEYMIGLNRITSMSFTWYNINARYNNQLIRYSKDTGSTFTNIAFPAGVWDYTNINQHIREVTVIKQENKEDEYPINLEFNETTFRVIITMKENYQLDLTKSDFYELIGYDKKIIKDKVSIGPRVPNLSQDAEILNVHCDLVNTSLVDGVESDIIYSFSTSILKPSYSFEREPIRVTYNPLNKNTISSIRIYITDGKRRVIDLNNQDVEFSLILKKFG